MRLPIGARVGRIIAVRNPGTERGFRWRLWMLARELNSFLEGAPQPMISLTLCFCTLGHCCVSIIDAAAG